MKSFGYGNHVVQANSIEEGLSVCRELDRISIDQELQKLLDAVKYGHKFSVFGRCDLCGVREIEHFTNKNACVMAEDVVFRHINSVEDRNRRQHDDRYHPLTCGNNRADERHVAYAEKNDHADYGILTAVEDGWLCPVCGWKQDMSLRVVSRGTEETPQERNHRKAIADLAPAITHVRDTLMFLNCQERIDAFHALMDGFCQHCGDETAFKKCNCRRDE